MKKKIAVFSSLLFLAPATVLAAPNQRGLDAMAHRDYVTAFKEYQYTAEKGDADSQAMLGMLYYEGTGVSQSYEKALEWFQRGANNGSVVAMYNLGGLYLKGLGTSQNTSTAANWYKAAADRGDLQAQMMMAWMASQGVGIPKNYEQALAWYGKAAAQGEIKAMYYLGIYYSKGLGTQPNLFNAYKWFSTAVFNLEPGKEQAGFIKLRDTVGAQLTPEQKQQADDLAHKWKPADILQSPQGNSADSGQAKTLPADSSAGASPPAPLAIPQPTEPSPLPPPAATVAQ